MSVQRASAFCRIVLLASVVVTVGLTTACGDDPRAAAPLASSETDDGRAGVPVAARSQDLGQAAVDEAIEEAGAERTRVVSTHPREERRTELTREQLEKLTSLIARGKQAATETIWQLSFDGQALRGAFEDVSDEEARWIEDLLLSVAPGDPRVPGIRFVLRERGRTIHSDGGRRGGEPEYPFAVDAVLGDDAERAARAIGFLAETPFAAGSAAAVVRGRLIEATRSSATAPDALLALAHLHGSEELLEPYFRQQISVREGAERAAALRALVHVSDRFTVGVSDVSGALITALSDDAPVVRIAALECVRGKVDVVGCEAQVVDCLRHPDRDVRLAAIDTVHRMSPLGLDGARTLAHVIATDDPEVVHQALWAVGQTGHGDKVPVARLTQSRTAEGRLTCPALIALRQHGAAAISALDDVMIAARESDTFDAYHAVITMRVIAPGDERTFALLAAQSTRGHYDIETESAMGLANFGERGVPYIAPMLSRRGRQQGAAAALSVACPDPARSTAVWAALASLDGGARDALAAWLRQRVPDDPRLELPEPTTTER